MIGILALQGAFQKHADVLEKLQIPYQFIKHPREVSSCLGLIIPGGESTVYQKLLTGEFLDQLQQFGKTKPIFGTCCGLILLSQRVVDHSVKTLALMDVVTSRNAYGSQVHSFEDQVICQLNQESRRVDGFFIRAPKIIDVGPSVQVLATHQDSPVIVDNGLHIGCTFHPELAEEVTLHDFFVKRCLKKSAPPQFI